MKAKHNSPGNSIDSSPNSLRKRTEEETLNLKPQLEFILGIRSTGLDIIDSNFNVVHVDSEWAQGYGNPAGRKCYEYFRGRSEVCPNCGAKKALETKSPVVTEGTMKKKRNRLVQVTTIPFQNEKGEWFVAEVNVDITERKRTEQALRESEGKYRTLIESIPQKIFLKDKNSVYISCNSNYAEDLKIKPEEIPGHTDYEFYPRDLAEKYRADDKRVVESGHTERFEERYIQQGQEKIVETFKTPFRDESGKLVGVLGIFHDITEQKEMERRRRSQEVAEARAEELSESRRRLIEAQESLRKEIAGQLHGTVQNRLILLGHKLAELEAKPASERTTGELASIRRRIEELQNDHIRPIGHRLFPSILRLGISAGLESLVDEYSTELHVDLQVSKQLRDREQANRRLIPDNVRLALYRIAEEALANILKHTLTAKNIVVKLSLSDGQVLRLTVSDDGAGFDTSSPSSGIGLAIASDYAAAAGGTYTIRSIPGKGTRVMVRVQLEGPQARKR